MNETRDLVRTWRSLEDGGEPMLLATLIRTAGSSYRRPGARMLMSQRRWLAGGISGGCLEDDLLRKAWWYTSSGRARRIEYDTMGDAEDAGAGFGLGCDGRLELLLEHLLSTDPVHPLRFIEHCFAAGEPGVMATVVRGDEGLGHRWLRDAHGWTACNMADERWKAEIERAAATALESERSMYLTLDAADVFVEVVLPPRPLVVFGSNYDVVPVIEQAKCVGWDVSVVARRASEGARERCARADAFVVAAPADIRIGRRTAVLVMTHNYESDLEILKSILPSPAPYVGILGPRTRTDRLLSDVLRAGVSVSPAQLQRVRAPVGLDLGAHGPADIALAMIAEIQSVMSQRSARPLSECQSRNAT
ncbi:XdhC family protein [Pendulispora rubella]|uniref:XdhC family protein n=1 Tax=Pendulispora rubella TaxID=2741070 RepID=A0ABZ2KSE9_9BACT